MSSANSGRTPKSDEHGAESSRMNTQGVDDKMGSPEVQAVVDGTIKRTEKASGHPVNSPERQAIHDAIEKNAHPHAR